MEAVIQIARIAPFATVFLHHFTWPQVLEFFLRLVVASVCGACIGIERSKRFKEAGIRTHVIVCMAAALFMIVSKFGFLDPSATAAGTVEGLRTADPARIAAQVVSGISFLGAGVIFRNGSTVKGLTTAAGIWATAAIGLAIGGGMYLLGIFGTVLIAILQFLMHKFKIGGDAASTRITLEVVDNRDFAKQLTEILARWHAKPTETKIIIGEDGTAKYDITIRTSENISADDIMAMFAENDAIKNIGFVTSD